ncbi:diaminobutyrate--2-oxoglutarate transaminase family protein [Streptomyces sp. NPDC056660]|uniref:diaminobutyrate--2-oxoglutarate transaminase family protein n=1 Tax=Streptomyces sp. NPDC056660 TaxID=3345897 RepID=UPI0036A13402
MAVTESVTGGTFGGAHAAHEGILRRQSARESRARTYARALPIVPVRARGLTIEGADGRRYLDCLSGAGTLALGHNHPVVLEAIRKVLDSGAPLSVLDLATPVKDAFITELFRTLPPGLADRARVQFCGPAGTDAVEAAFKLVRAATGRTGILAFTGAYHGMTTGALAASGGADDVRVARLPYPQDYRCPFGVGGPVGAELAARWTESVLDDPKSGVPLPAGMILEPVQGEGGVIPAPDEWLRRMRRLTADRSIPLVADEIQTGVGRTGAFWAVEHSGVTPDVMVLSKAIGGSLPLAVVVYRDDLDVWEPGAHAGTFRGNQLAMAAGTATLAHVRENGLAERAGHLGSRMLSQLRVLQEEFACVGDVRGRGLMIGVELVDPEGEERAGAAGERRAGVAEEGCVRAVGAAGEAGVRPAGEGEGEVWGSGRAVEMRGGALGGGAMGGGGLDGGAIGVGGLGGGAMGGGGWDDDAVSGGGWSGGVASGGHRGGGEASGGDRGGGAVSGWGGAGRPRPHPAAPELASAVQRACLERGLIVELGGRHAGVVRLLPPLNITDEQATAVLDRLADAVAAVARDPAAHGVRQPRRPDGRKEPAG